MRHYFLGMAAEYTDGRWFKHLFTMGRRRDLDALRQFLAKKYNGEAVLCKNGRSALTLALKEYFKSGDKIIVNGFTCYAVYEAVKAAGLKPVFVDISRKDLNFDYERLEKHGDAKGIIVQNTLGNPVDIKRIEKFANEHDMTIIEDLAHCAGIRYADKREAGTVGVASVLSFGKDKSIDTVSGGAVVFRTGAGENGESTEQVTQKFSGVAPSKGPRPSDHLRARFYPMFGALCRTLTYIKLGGGLMRVLVKIHWVEKSADNKLDLERRLSKFEAKLALRQLKDLRRTGEPALREFCFVRDRAEVLKKLQKKGYYFGGLWYEKPVSPARYYQKVHFPEEECPNAVYVAEHILNLPTYYTRKDLKKAREIIKEYKEEGNE